MNRKQFLGSLFTLPFAAKLLAKKAEAAHAEKKPMERTPFYFVCGSMNVSTSAFRWDNHRELWSEDYIWQTEHRKK